MTSLVVMFILTSIHAQTYPVNWSTLKNAEVVNGVLQRESTAQNRGIATSQQLLFGSGQTNTSSGYFEFTVTSNTDLKKIGFVALDDPEEQVGGITYGFSFLANGKVRAIGVDSRSSKISYSTGDVFRIERAGGRVVNFYINGNSVYAEPGDVLQSYQIRANLKSDGASFSNVVCSYQTTPFCVVPEIDNVNNTIRLAISGAYPPYTYMWDHGPVLVGNSTEDPSGEPIYQVPTDGNYWVTIQDAAGNEFRKRYSVGNDISWSNLYQTSVSADLLTFNGSNKWGTATHSSSFNQNSTGWVEYVIDHDNGKRAFGYVDATQTVRKSRHLNAGFLITKDAMQVINEGNIVFSGEYENKDVLTLHYIQGTVIWMKNGVEFFTAPYVGSGDLAIAGLLRGGAVEKHLYYSFNPDSYITKVWNDPEDSGDITVNIASLNEPGPYHYVISKERIPELFETYAFLKDSLGLPVDSTQFFTGSETATSFTFENLEAGTYNVAVFNSQGERIFGQEVELYGELGIEAGAGLIVAGNTIQSLQDNAAGSLELYLTQGENLGMEIEVNRNNNSIQQFIGLADVQSTVNGYQDLTYGFYLDGRRLYTVQNGVLSSEFEIIRQNKTLEIRIEDGELILHANMNDIVTVQLPAQYTYKVGAGMDQGALLKLNFPGKPPVSYPYKTFSGVSQHLNCDTDNGQFFFSFSAWSSLSGATASYTVTHVPSGTVVFTANQVGAGFSQVFNASTTGSPLEAGTYEISGTISNGTNSYAFTEEISLGYEADWAQIDQNYLEIPNSYSALVDGHDESSFLQARSRNIMRYDEAGWIEFTPILENSAANFIRPTTLNLNDIPSLSTLSEEFAVFYKFSAFNNYYWTLPFSPSQGYVTPFFVSDNSRIKMVFKLPVTGGSTYGEIDIYVDGDYKETIERGNSSIIARFNSIMNGDGFQDVITSFPCPLPSDIYGHLKYKMDGFHHTMKDGEIKFVFDQEYAEGPLTFNIYDQEDNLVKTQADFPTVSTTYGDNYLTLDVTENGECIGRGFFYLEVINSKKEKLYLRFFNDYSLGGCQNYITN